MRTTFLATAALALVLAAPAFAQTTQATAAPGAVENTHTGIKVPTTTATMAANGKLSQAEQQFLKQAAQGSNYEMAVAKLAQQKATQQDIKDYARKVIADHAQLNTQLQQIAAENNIQLPAGMTAEQESQYDNLKKLSGKQFDQAFITDVKAINQNDKAEEQRIAARTANNPQFQSFVQQMQNDDSRHAEMAQKLKA